MRAVISCQLKRKICAFAESLQNLTMVNSKKVAATLPLPKKQSEKPPLLEELTAGNKGKGKVKVCSVEVILVVVTSFLPGIKCQRGRKSSCQQECKVWPSVPCGKVNQCTIN